MSPFNPDLIELDGEHGDDCILVHDANESPCVTVEDFLSAKADDDYDRMKDRDV